MIDKFEGEFRWLSNFSPHPVEWEGKRWPTVEHAFQAAKTIVDHEAEQIRLAPTPGQAKRMGRKVTLRADWEEIKLDVMARLVEQKFRQHPDLRRKLLDTGHEALVEGNTWGDKFWGICDGDGTNWLGLILMWVRSQLREAS